MRVFMFATQRGFMRFIFAHNEQQANDIWTLELVFTAAEPSTYFCQELPLSRVVEDHRDQMREALALGIEGIGEFHGKAGWRIYQIGEGSRYKQDAGDDP